MFKPTILKIILTVVLGGGFYFVASNAHFDAFPCEKASFDYETNRLRPTTTGTCDLLSVKRSGQGPMADYAKLTGAGYAVEGLLFVLLPYIVACLVGHAIQKKKAASA